MRADTPPAIPSASTPLGVPDAPAKRASRWSLRREVIAVGAILLAGALLRLALAARGWPSMNSDEAVMGLMTDDILWRHAHPIFFYGQHYMGALQAYFAVPFFALLGPTSLALHAATTTVTLAALALLYLFVRAVYSRGVALLCLALLALGSQHAMHDELHSGAGTQDTLLFGAALLLLVYLWLRHPPRRLHRLSLAFGIGVTIGLGLWGDFLIVPFIFAALVALATDAVRQYRSTAAPVPEKRRTLAVPAGLCALGCLLGLWPLLSDNIANDGATITQVLMAAGLIGGGSSTAHLSIFGHVQALAQQVAATLIVGLPRTFGNEQVCVNCALWPAPHATLAAGRVLLIVALSLPFSLVAIALWTAAARLLLRDVRAERSAGSGCVGRPQEITAFDACWWGRAMLVIAAAVTVLEYAASRASFLYAGASIRYLVGLFLCVPLILHPLWVAAQPTCHTLLARLRRTNRTVRQRRSVRHGRAAFLALTLLVALFVLDGVGTASAVADTADHAAYGVPAGTRDAAVLAFLQAHDATRFYAGYWTCYRLAFEAREQSLCAVVSDTDAFASGQDRVPAFKAAVRAAPHPAFVFDTTRRDEATHLPDQITARIDQRDPRFSGYTVARVADFVIFYYSGAE